MSVQPCASRVMPMLSGRWRRTKLRCLLMRVVRSGFFMGRQGCGVRGG